MFKHQIKVPFYLPKIHTKDKVIYSLTQSYLLYQVHFPTHFLRVLHFFWVWSTRETLTFLYCVSSFTFPERGITSTCRPYSKRDVPSLPRESFFGSVRSELIWLLSSLKRPSSWTPSSWRIVQELGRLRALKLINLTFLQITSEF